MKIMNMEWSSAVRHIQSMVSFSYSVNVKGGGRRTLPRRSAPNGVRTLLKNENVALNERKPMVPNFKVSGQPMTPVVRSNTLSEPLETTIFVILHCRL